MLPLYRFCYLLFKPLSNILCKLVSFVSSDFGKVGHPEIIRDVQFCIGIPIQAFGPFCI